MVKKELRHHGILGMKWGQRNGPPYPLQRSQMSWSERRQQKKNYKVYKKASKKWNTRDAAPVKKGVELLDSRVNNPLDFDLTDEIAEKITHELLGKYGDKKLRDSWFSREKYYTTIGEAFAEEIVAAHASLLDKREKSE